MWLTLLFGLVNAVMSFFGNRVVKFSGFDIAPAGIIILAWRGENVLFAALILTLSYSFVSLREMRYLWLTLPLTILIGYLALAVHSALLLIVLYHVIGLLAALALGYFGFRYVIFILLNASLNLLLARLYGAFF